jgi:hypothetical protein
MTRLILLVIILLGQFAVLEAGLRMFGGMEANPAFQSLFMPDDRIGYRLRPGASARYSTTEFSTDLAINQQGVRDSEQIGPKAANERRVLMLGDSLVLAIQVPLDETFGERLEVRLNRADPAHRWRVINGGVQGYGPVEEWLFYRHVASAFEPDIVLIFVTVANDAIEAADARVTFELGRVPDGTPMDRSRARFRRVVRSSMVLQLVRLRADQFRGRRAFAALSGYLADPPPFVSDGLRVAQRAFGRIAEHAHKSGAKVGLVLIPARFQTHDEEFQTLSAIAERAGGVLVRHAATERFTEALKPLGEAVLDLLPVFAPLEDSPGLYFVRNAHLSPRGHRVTADAIFDFLHTKGLLERLPTDGF